MTKNLFLSALAVLCIFTLNAKPVKFAVDMGTFTISPFGVHVMGDFQTAAGYTANFDPASIPMVQQGSSAIYTVMVNIPAFQKIEYKFVNGDQTYEVEFVPLHSRVDDFNDNRWLYIDSLSNDTTFVGVLPFSGNAPAGKTLLRFVVDMQNATPVSGNGVHVGSTFQGMDPATHRLCNLNGSKYEIIAYINNGTEEFLYYNGNLPATTETVPTECAVNGKRSFTVTQDTIMPTVCFSGCAACPVGISERNMEFFSLKLFPNPASSRVTIFNQKAGEADKIILVDISGKIIDEITVENKNSECTELNVEKYGKGTYQVFLKSGPVYYHARLLIQ